jgi:hypothetical protein
MEKQTSSRQQLQINSSVACKEEQQRAVAVYTFDRKGLMQQGAQMQHY